jgi:HPt (histidine-containing phosphotransfer) domain-containing protein
MDLAVLDHGTFQDLQETAGAEFVAELLDTFFEEAPGLLAELRHARAAGDGERFRRAAHSLKSNGQTFGALRFGALARALELQGLNTDATQDAAAILALEAAFEEAATQLRTLRHG